MQVDSSAAREWQLSWSAAEGVNSHYCSASAMLKRLRVNTSSFQQLPGDQESKAPAGQLPAPPPLPVPWVLAFSALHVELTMMASSGVLINGQSFPRETAVLELLDPKVILLTVSHRA